jgi:hypothetical protein
MKQMLMPGVFCDDCANALRVIERKQTHRTSKRTAPASSFSRASEGVKSTNGLSLAAAEAIVDLEIVGSARREEFVARRAAGMSIDRKWT